MTLRPKSCWNIITSFVLKKKQDLRLWISYNSVYLISASISSKFTMKRVDTWLVSCDIMILRVKRRYKQRIRSRSK